MALGFTLKYQGRLDDKKMRIYDIVHDGSTTDITAKSIGLNYIDSAIMKAGTVVAETDLTTNQGTTLVMATMSDGSITTLVALGT